MNVISGIPALDLLGEMPLIRFVKNIDLHYLLSPQGLRSMDQNGKKEIIEKVISDLGYVPQNVFSSAAICHNRQAYETLKLYGDVLLLVNKEMVQDDAFIFNRDFQDLWSIEKVNAHSEQVNAH